ncbi:SGNH/GDSL hydrolase family protein [Lentibacillus sediminis]|uniref:SGNH/GDSL hydrolase family protein n=1 Tax=Lentibacillus sediminis TaxID=1940529 RepID=UPI001EFE587D|nr:SGNH/GDSL hydrolase family protein [Lentibacillus sediminis]
MNLNRRLIALLLLTAGAMFIWINYPRADLSNVTITQPEDQSPQEEQTVEEPEQEEEATEDETTTAEESEPRQFSEVVADALQNTVEFFSGEETHVVAIGDSLTKGVGAEQEEGGYVGILNRAINEETELVTFENYGVRGHRSDQLLARLDEPEITSSIEQADIVLMTIGANDIMKVVKETFTDLNLEDFAEARIDYENRLEQILLVMQEINPDSEIYLVGFYNPFSTYFEDIEELDFIISAWNDTGRTLAQQHENVTFIPTVDLFEDSEADLFALDNFHPNDLGYRLIAQRVLDYITEEEG